MNTIVIITMITEINIDKYIWRPMMIVLLSSCPYNTAKSKILFSTNKRDTLSL